LGKDIKGSNPGRVRIETGLRKLAEKTGNDYADLTVNSGRLEMEGWKEVLEILGFLIFWLLLTIYVAPRVKGGFS
jgi:hypothetical protein